jgi:hypothetical protein
MRRERSSRTSPNEELHGATEGDRIAVDLRNPKSFLAPEDVVAEAVPPDVGTGPERSTVP